MKKEVLLPPLPDKFEYTGEWRQPKQFDYYLDLLGDLRVLPKPPDQMGSHHIVIGPENLKIKYLTKRRNELAQLKWRNPITRELELAEYDEAILTLTPT